MPPRSFEERRADRADRVVSFEGTYPRYEFPELVRLAMALGAWLGGMRHRLERRRTKKSGSPALNEVRPAE